MKNVYQKQRQFHPGARPPAARPGTAAVSAPQAREHARTIWQQQQQQSSSPAAPGRRQGECLWRPFEGACCCRRRRRRRRRCPCRRCPCRRHHCSARTHTPRDEDNKPAEAPGLEVVVSFFFLLIVEAAPLWPLHTQKRAGTLRR
ncbi:unnamed protein product [Schistocephalus solidus]|uniref:Uncharacterized protein n=1 Tax=Schistocephalus solidus TaxID=70667 RepID=A0A183T2U0_SCHSO|nr:unnamed protein product [Schistocephalus solidus]